MNIEEKRLYYEKQRPNLLYPNERYINSIENINKADLHRMKYVYENNKELTGKMLDVGCNDGYFMRNFSWKFEKYLGIDMFSIEEYIGDLRFKGNVDLYTKSGRIEYKKGLFEEIQLQEKFDFIFAGEIIEHVKNPDVFLEKAKSLLGGKGIMCITTPNNIGKEQPEHYRQYSKETLYDVLKLFFTNIQIVELPQVNDSWPFLYAKCYL